MNRNFYIITIFNKEKLISDVVYGVIKNLSEDSKNYIICVLDGCKDNTENVIDEIASKNLANIIKLKVDDVHELLSLNAAFKYIDDNFPILKEHDKFGLEIGYSQSDDIYYLLQDDVILEENFEKPTREIYKEYPTAGYISFRCGMTIKSNGTSIDEYEFVESEFGHWKQMGSTNFRELKQGEMIFCESLIKSPTAIKRDVLNHVGYFDEKLAPFGHDDTDLCIRLNMLGYQNVVKGVKFKSLLSWGGTREHGRPDHDRIIVRNNQYLTKKHANYFKNRTQLKDLLLEYEKSKDWVDTYEYNNFIYDWYLSKVDSYDFLSNHHQVVSGRGLGYGERAFRYFWLLIGAIMRPNSKFLEIGVYKGSILALMQLISDKLNKSFKIYGATPLDPTGDKYGSYDNTNYLQDIKNLYSLLGLNISNLTLIKGLSTSDNVKTNIHNFGTYDCMYIDGGHDYETVVNDLQIAEKELKPGGFLVLDDSSSDLKLSGREGRFNGHPDVARAVKSHIDNNENYTHLFACGHNRLWRKKYE